MHLKQLVVEQAEQFAPHVVQLPLFILNPTEH